MSEKEKNIRKEITKILIELGIPLNLQGFHFFRECIVKVVYDPTLMRNVTKVLYPEVGTMFEVTGSVVERSMRHASDIGFTKTKFKPIKRIFNIEEFECNYKLTNSELIAMLAEHIRVDMDEVI